MCQLYTATNCVTMSIQHNTCSVRYAVFMVLSPWRLHRSRQFLSDSVSRKVSPESFSLSYQQGTVLCKRGSSVLPYKCRYRNQSLQHDVQRKRHYSLPSNIYSDSSNKRSCVFNNVMYRILLSNSPMFFSFPFSLTEAFIITVNWLDKSFDTSLLYHQIPSYISSIYSIVAQIHMDISIQRHIGTSLGLRFHHDFPLRCQQNTHSAHSDQRLSQYYGCHDIRFRSTIHLHPL